MKTNFATIETNSNTIKPYTTDWNENDFKTVKKALKKYFCGKSFLNHKGEDIKIYSIFQHLEYTLGLPYVSSSSFPMLVLDCNVLLYHPTRKEFYYNYAFLDNNNNVVLALTDKDENELFISILIHK